MASKKNNPPKATEKFRSDLNRPKSCEMSERLLKTLRKSGDFQAEYEGSIPFTRSSAPRKTYPAKSGSNPGIKNGRSRPRWSHSVHREKAAQDSDGRRQEAAWPVDGDGRQGQR